MTRRRSIISEVVFPALDRAEALAESGHPAINELLKAVRGLQEAGHIRREHLTDFNQLPSLDQMAEELLWMEIALTVLEETGIVLPIPDPDFALAKGLMGWIPGFTTVGSNKRRRNV